MMTHKHLLYNVHISLPNDATIDALAEAAVDNYNGDVDDVIITTKTFWERPQDDGYQLDLA